MRLTVVTAAFAVCALAFAVALAIVANAVPDGACAGPVFDTTTCEGARLRESIFAAGLAGSALVSAAVVTGALLVSWGRTRGGSQPSSGHGDA